ncbi:MAG TPA: glycosyltransferase family 9 protein [Prolixibacteraceae bacterium]|nr:glycosyltransferase family 9 protein [Prolixibacteraceae bacterium]
MIKFLAIRFSSIGDIVLTSPVIRCLNKQVDGAEIHFVVKEKHRDIVASNPHITKVHVFKGNLKALIQELKAEQFDYIIDLHQNFRSNRLKNQLQVPSFTFEKLNIQKFLLVNFKINRMPAGHIVDRYMQTLSVFDVKNDGEGLEFFISHDKEFDRNKLPKPFQTGFISFVIAGTYFTKKIPADKIAEICRKINRPVVLLGGKNEFHTGEKISSGFKGQVVNFAGKISLHESASLVRDSKLVLTNDTGLMHIASAFKKKILSFWGNTVPEFGMVPYQPHPASKILQVNGLKCRPCSKLGYQKCPKKHFKCMTDINVEEVTNWVEQNY